MADTEYGAGSITVLEGLDAVRKRPGMYIGTTGERGLHHLVWEVVNNSVDEALAGHASIVDVVLERDGSVTVTDDGRGFPVDLHPTLKIPGVEVALTVLHAGGKFDSKSYKVSGGLHGVGVSVVNALSSKMSVEIERSGHQWRQEYAYAIPGPLVKGAPTDATGSKVSFWPDAEIFETTEWSWETIELRLREMAFLNKGLRISLNDLRLGGTNADGEPRTAVFCYADGLADFVRHLNGPKVPSHPSVIGFEASTGDLEVEVAMQWNESYTESVHTFANAINTHEGGTHEEGFRAALTSYVNRYGADKKLLKADEKLTGEDIREGLTAIVSVKLGEPQFEGQTKTRLGNTDVKGFVQKVVNEHLSAWFEEHPAEARIVVTKASQASRARQAAQSARKLSRRKSLLESSSMPGKLSDCQSNDPGECEIFIVEGDSAGGCFSGDTLVATVEGHALSFRELVADAAEGVLHYGYATDDHGDVHVVLLDAPRLTRKAASLVSVELDDGSAVRCTPDHLFRLRDGSYRRADALQPDDSLMPLQRRLTDRGQQPGPGYELVWANGRERWEHTHHLADRYSLERGLAHWSHGIVRHHVDFNKRNNSPENLLRMTPEGHLALHAAQASRTLAPLWQDPEFRAMKIASARESALRQWQNPEYRELKRTQVRAQRQNEELNARLLQGFQDWYAGLDEESLASMHQRLSLAQQEYWSDPAAREEASDRVRTWFGEHPEQREHLRELASRQWSDVELRAWRSRKTLEQWQGEGYREHHGAAVRAWWADNPQVRDEKREHLQRKWQSEEFRESVATGLQRYRDSTSKEEKAARISEGYRRKALRMLADVLESVQGLSLQEVYEERRLADAPTGWRFSRLLEFYGNDEDALIEAARLHNHRAVSVTHLIECEDVYDLTVEEHHNFALECGIFVHNSAKQGRNSRIQAILPIRGKILNVEKANLERVLGNNEVQALITAFGTGIHAEFDISKLRYHKVVLMADADVDGQHIQTLLLTFLFRFMRPLIELGHVYLAAPPLYKVKWNRRGDDAQYAFSDAHRDQLVATRRLTKPNAKPDDIQRFKGLGEMNFAELWDTTMDPNTRTLRQVTLDDAAIADELFGTLMGDDVQARRSFIQQNAKDVRFLDI